MVRASIRTWRVKFKQWIQQLRASSVDSGRGVTVDSYDNIYVMRITGVGLVEHANFGANDFFLEKYNSYCVNQ
ncbi:uncharacterized protein METZ01_LOCUS337053 [marine metagenome]|uniref:Uncharacterized protein n=1 Tax=marine metagenome TaxID=408172 RepID=A0A382QF79_9ZZZZ